MRRPAIGRIAAFGPVLITWAACLTASPESPLPGGRDAGHDAAVAVDCDGLFGDLGGYQTCGASGELCDFWIDLDDESTCQEVCESREADCVQSYDSSSETPCVREEAEGCVGVHSTHICICDVVPGAPDAG